MPTFPAFGLRPYYTALRDWLYTSHNEDGTLNESAVTTALPSSVAVVNTPGAEGEVLTVVGGVPDWAPPTGGGGSASLPFLVLSDYAGVDPTGATNSKAGVDLALADVATRGGTLLVEPGIYDISPGIQENVRGLRMIGLGTRKLGPGEVEDTGVIFKNTTAGAWTWQHGDDTVVYNEYSGATFENITFSGDPGVDTAGGLMIKTSNCRVVNCGAFRHRAGKGFATIQPTKTGGGSAADASWQYFESCFAVDCFIGFDMGSGVNSGGNGGQMVSCVTVKTGNANANVAQHTGHGIRISTNNFTVLGGKVEQEGVGLEVLSWGAVTVTGTRAEQCTTEFSLNRPSGAPYPSNISLIGPVSQNPAPGGTSVYIGPENWQDVIVGSFAGPVDDNGTDTAIYTSGSSGGGGDTVALTFTFGDGVNAIASGQWMHLRVPFAGTITGWHINSDNVGSFAATVKRASSGSPTAYSTISGTEAPTLSSARTAFDTSLTTWTTAISAGDWLLMQITSVATVKSVTVSIDMEKA